MYLTKKCRHLSRCWYSLTKHTGMEGWVHISMSDDSYASVIMAVSCWDCQLSLTELLCETFCPSLCSFVSAGEQLVLNDLLSTCIASALTSDVMCSRLAFIFAISNMLILRYMLDHGLAYLLCRVPPHMTLECALRAGHPVCMISSCNYSMLSNDNVYKSTNI